MLGGTAPVLLISIWNWMLCSKADRKISGSCHRLLQMYLMDSFSFCNIHSFYHVSSTLSECSATKIHGTSRGKTRTCSPKYRFRPRKGQKVLWRTLTV